MVKLKDLKLNEEYYIVDEDGCCDDIIIRFKVLKTIKNKKMAEVRFLKYIDDDIESDVLYSNDENGLITEKLYKNDENRIFKLEQLEEAKVYLDDIITEKEFDKEMFDIDSYIPPEDYPDWDGDESILYLIEHASFSDYEEDEE